MTFPEIFDNWHQSEKNSKYASDLEGRIIGIQLGVVTVNDDPENLRRIKCKFPQNPDLDSYWLMRSNPSHNIDVPVARIDDTVIVNFVQGDPSLGLYQVLENKVNLPHPTSDPLIDYSQIVEGSYFLNVGAKTNVESEGDINLSSGDKLAVNVNQTIDIKSGDSITIKSNGIAILKINPNGSILLNSINVNITAETNISLTSPTLSLNAGTIDCLPGVNVNFKDSNFVKFENCNRVEFNNVGTAKIDGHDIAVVGASVSTSGGSGTITNKGW